MLILRLHRHLQQLHLPNLRHHPVRSLPHQELLAARLGLLHHQQLLPLLPLLGQRQPQRPRPKPQAVPQVKLQLQVVLQQAPVTATLSLPF